MSLPGLLPSNLPSLSRRLRERTNELQSRIIKANYSSQFARAAPELTDFRHAIAGRVDGVDDEILCDLFRRTVPFTTYDAYLPFIEKLLEKPCKASAIINLLAPGLPDYLVDSSSTSGGLPKIFPRYNCRSKIGSPDAGSWAVSDPSRRRTRAYIYCLCCDQMEVEGSNTRIYISSSSVLRERISSHLDPEKDEEKMGIFVLDHAAPYAATFIKKWGSFLLIHAVFMVGSRSIETMDMVFINTFVAMIRHLDMEFDMVVDCIANGIIPDVDGIAEVRHHLESNLFPDPERAAELRKIGRPSSRPGWCGYVWPNLHSVTTIASGSFASSIPLARWFLGFEVDICTPGYGSTESPIGLPYNPLELNHFKPRSETVIEFLDIGKDDSISSLSQLWEVEVGRRYEVVLTTQNGLWRYRLADVVEVSGFDPTDGTPIIQFIERRNVAIRFPDFMVTEEELRAAMSSVTPSMLTKVVNWTAMIDDRRPLATIGFFVELADDQVPLSDLAIAPECVFDELLRLNKNIAITVAHDIFSKPTIRLVRSGTFSDFLQLKLDEGSDNVGQVKVPVVLPKAAYVTWFSHRVVQEL